MIILSDQDSKDDTYSGTTLRHPSLARTRSSATLPPYEQYAPSLITTLSSAPVRKVKFYRNQRVWKIAGIAFVVYVALTLLIGLPIILRVSALVAPLWRSLILRCIGSREAWILKASVLWAIPTPFSLSTTQEKQ